MAKRGAKLKLNSVLQKKICDDIATGIPITHAAVINGIDKTTHYKWYNKGKEAESGIFREYYLEVEKAKSLAIALRVETIRKAGDNDWKSAAWWLERVDPENFARKDKYQHKVEADVKATVLLSDLFDDDELNDILEEEDNDDDDLYDIE